jgi:acetyl esterase/lipase
VPVRASEQAATAIAPRHVLNRVRPAVGTGSSLHAIPNPEARMRKLVPIALAWLLLSSVVPAAHAAPAPEPSAELKEFLARVDPPITLRVPGMDRVRVLRDQAYGSLASQRCDVYLPLAPAKGGAPAVVLLHGGMGPDFPVRPKEWGIYKSWGRALAASGFVTIVANHRAGYPEPALDQAQEDIRALVTSLRANARDWSADASRFAMAAYSGGGPVLAVPLRDKPEGLRALVGVYPIVDPSRSDFLKQALNEADQQRFSPVAAMEAANGDIPPTLILRAGDDSIPGLLAGLDHFVVRALALDAPLSLVSVRNAPHGFDNDAGLAGSAEALEQMVAFLRANLAARPGAKS